jgi:SOS-response transcriptional repressor LexA
MRTPSSGRVVAALVDGEEVLRTYLVEAGRPWLRAENPAYTRRTPCRELVVQGVAVGLLRFAEPADGRNAG